MRRVRYSVAASLDGFIAGPQGQFDWIVMDDAIDFEAYYGEFDLVLMGRRSYEAVGGAWQGMKTAVVSRTLRPEDHPEVQIVSSDLAEHIHRWRQEAGKDIWLFGGGELLRSLLDLGLVDIIEVAIMPVVLGAGIPLLAPPFTPCKLKLLSHRVYESGIVWVNYGVERQAAEAS